METVWKDQTMGRGKSTGSKNHAEKEKLLKQKKEDKKI